MSGSTLSFTFAEEAAKDRELLLSTASSLSLMQPGENSQPWHIMNLWRIIQVGSVTNPVTKKKQGCTKLQWDQFDGYKALKLYLEKVNPNCSSFFQYPKANFSPEEDVWFEQRPLGVNTLANMMKKISEAAGLSKIYTNHSIRATAITLWSNAGVPNRHIMSISGHRNEQSHAHYNFRPSVSQLKNCSDVLSRALSAPSTSCVTAASQVQSQVEVKSGLRQKANQEIHPLQVAREAAPLFQNCTIQTVQFVFNRLQQT